MMTDMEKMLQILKHCIDYDGGCYHCPIYSYECNICGMYGERHIRIPFPVMQETIKLLEEQAMPVDTKVIGTECGDIEVYCCRACKFQLDPTFHFCPNCGKEVIWNDQQRENY